MIDLNVVSGRLLPMSVRMKFGGSEETIACAFSRSCSCGKTDSQNSLPN